MKNIKEVKGNLDKLENLEVIEISSQDKSAISAGGDLVDAVNSFFGFWAGSIYKNSYAHSVGGGRAW